jgi:predicted nucleotidyltransferase
MRKMKNLDALLPKNRQDILVTLFGHPQKEWYLSQLAQHLRVRPSTLQRELANLTEAGILKTHKVGNLVYYQADPQCPFFPELQGLFKKTTGVIEQLRLALKPFKNTAAFVFGSFARGEERSNSDLDLLVIGPVGLADLSPMLRRLERQLVRAIQVTIYSPQEFAAKVKERNHFVTAVLDGDKLFVVGTQDELEEITR